MKRLKKAALAVACAAVLCSVFSGCGGDKKDTAKAAPAEEKVLTVYTARSESLNNLVIPAFEKETGIKVLYEEATTPEEMYSKYTSSTIPYDLICSSDYMIERLIADGADKFVEIGPGKTLTGFMRKINRDVAAVNIDKYEDFEKFVAESKNK